MMGLDFVNPSFRSTRSGSIEVYPKFLIRESKDLMIRANDFYAVWLENENRWSTNYQDAVDAVDKELRTKADELNAGSVAYMWDADSGSAAKWNTYCQKLRRESWKQLDMKLVFANETPKKEDYSSKKLPYSLSDGDISAYDKLIGTLYDKDNRHKIEWMIGSIVSGDSRKLQKFYVFYGAPGTGKSTIMNIVQSLFEGYWCPFDSKALGDSNKDFSLEPFKNGPLVSIDHDNDLSHLDTNVRLNSIVSHETMVINEKHKGLYANKFYTTLIIGTNDPVKITNTKSGILRRLIDINPTGNVIPMAEYLKLISDVEFELGAIAKHCLDVYEKDKHYYDKYIATEMLLLTSDIYNFVLDNYLVFENLDKEEGGITLSYAYDLYKKYCEEGNMIAIKRSAFKNDFADFFTSFSDRKAGKYMVYSGFRIDKFENKRTSEEVKDIPWLEFSHSTSIFDKEYADCPAQLTTEEGNPIKKWDDVTTKLSDIDTSELHFVRPPENHIVIDFDIADANGNKCLELNLKEAAKFPPTYAELSKSGQGIHLHYTYEGDVTKLSRYFDDKIEIKVFTGKSALRRKLTRCNDIRIKPISSNLPLKGDKKVLDEKGIKNEHHLRCMILKCLNKEYGATVCNVDFMAALLKDAYDRDVKYDISDMKMQVYNFCLNSTHQKQKCIQTYMSMPFKSKHYESVVDDDPSTVDETAPIVFFDCEVFPNLLLINWKEQGEDKPIHRMINPTPSAVKELIRFRLIGFNNRDYDNHILYGRMLGYSEKEIYLLSKRIISGQGGRFGNAYNLSYSDIYDFSSDKKSLKKWEIELHIHHKELGLSWDEPVPQDKWDYVSEYCDNDVTATEIVFNECKGDWLARLILAKLTGMTPNDTTNSLTGRLIFGENRHPQSEFQWRHMGKADGPVHHDIIKDGIYYNIGNPEYTIFNDKDQPIFPGYEFDQYGNCSYRGENPSKGGLARGTPGIYFNLALLDIASLHPHSAYAERVFGEVFSENFYNLVRARLFIKHKELDGLKTLFNGALMEYVTDEESLGALSQALKIAINAVYGLTSASFDNLFKDPNNVDNIVAKRGALFMINLMNEVTDKGYKVVHIKTDSIKIADATLEIIQFVMDYGKMYGYTFEHEATYDRICLVGTKKNKDEGRAVYIAKYATLDKCYELYGKDYVESEKDICKNNKKHGGEWTATGTEFAVPYIFKTLFSHEELTIYDYAITKESHKGPIYLDKNELNPDDHNRVFVGKIGQFTPVKNGGGLLVVERALPEGEFKYDNVQGSSGYRWLETEEVIEKGLYNDIDKEYFVQMANAAVNHINEYGSFDEFIA